MDNPMMWLIVVGAALAGLGTGFLLGKNSLKGQPLAWECAQKLQADPAFAPKLEAFLHPPPAPSKPSGVPVRLLTLLQRSGRFLDFLLENFQGASDNQIASAIRDLHPKWQETVKKHLVVEPVMSQEEGSEVNVPAGFDPSAIQLVGNISGNPPFKGTLRHPGWRVKEIKLPELPKGQDDLVLMPAEVEIA